MAMAIRRSDLEALSEVFSFVPGGLLEEATRFKLGEALLAGKIAPTPNFAGAGGGDEERYPGLKLLLILVAALLLVGYVAGVAVLGLLLSPWFFLLLLLLLALLTLPLILGDRTGRVRRYRQDRPPRGSGS